MSIPLTPHGPAAGSVPPQAKARRRAPTAVEQARRVAWGREWGAIMREHSQRMKGKVG